MAALNEPEQYILLRSHSPVLVPSQQLLHIFVIAHFIVSASELSISPPFDRLLAVNIQFLH